MELDDYTLTDMFQADIETENDTWCFDYSGCTFKYAACHQSVRPYLRYTSASAAWVLLCSIIVFFMKAGFMLVELAFASSVKDRRNVVILKHQDAFASAFGFFLIGFDISGYSSPQNIPRSFFQVTDPMLWFFKFTFASNAATVVGGVLVTNQYKLRLPAAFLSTFFISGIIHPVIARLIWSDNCSSLSPYRFCTDVSPNITSNACNYGCSHSLTFSQRMYILDFAGGGAVHMLGGIAGLVISLLAKLQEYRDKGMIIQSPNNRLKNVNSRTSIEAEDQEMVTPRNFLEWMYPESGGEESVSDAALGVVILWFCWFAFNCGSTESVQVGIEEERVLSANETYYPYYGISSTIAVNMIMAAASGGTLAVIIAVWAQIRCRSDSVNANEIANGILSALVGITAGCAFVDYWAACLIGAISVVLYHLGCFIEYKFKLKDTARVVPVHGVCGLWSIIAIGIFQAGDPARCNLHAAFEGLCYCHLRLPTLTQGEVFISQLVGALAMIGISVIACSLLYGILYLLPMQPFVRVAEKIFFLTPKNTTPLYYKGGWLFTSPADVCQHNSDRLYDSTDLDSTDAGGGGGDDLVHSQFRDIISKPSPPPPPPRSSVHVSFDENTALLTNDTNLATYNSSGSERVDVTMTSSPYGTVRREGSTHTASTSYHDRPYGKKKEGQKQSSSE